MNMKSKIQNTAVIETVQKIISKINSIFKTCVTTYTEKVVPVIKRVTSCTHSALVWIINFVFSLFLPKEAEAGCKKLITRFGIPVALIAGIYLFITGTTFSTVIWGIVVIMAPKFIVNNLKLK